MPAIIKIRNLTKTFTSQTSGTKKIKALNGITLDIQQGEILGILGPNGAGKTTFLNILSTLLLADGGTVDINGIRLAPSQFMRLRKILNMSSGHPNFPWSLTVEENLKFYGMLYGLKGQALTKKISALIEMFGLQEFARQRFDELSSGTKQKLSLAKTLLNDPKIIFLDEPTVGLDPDVAIKIRDRILDIFKKTQVTILLTTHNMQEAESMCSRIAFIRHGQLIRLAKPDELKKMEGKDNLEDVFIQLAGQPQGLMPQTINQHEEMGQEPICTRGKEDAWSPEKVVFWGRRVKAFAYRNAKFATGNFFSFIELVFWPIVSLVSIGLLGDYMKLHDKALAFVMTGAIAGGILQVTQLDASYSLLYEVWSKSMKHTFLAPVGASESLLGSWFVGMARGSLIFIILAACAVFLFGFTFPPVWVVLIFLAGIFGCALLLGLLVSILILVFGQKAEITAWMFAYLFMLVSGIYYPVNTLPKFFYYFAQAVPITYFLEFFRASFGFKPLLSFGLAKGFGLIVLYFVLGLKVMQFAFYQARKKGTIVRLSE